MINRSKVSSRLPCIVFELPAANESKVTNTDPEVTATSEAMVIVTQTLSDTTTGEDGEQSIVIQVSSLHHNSRPTITRTDRINRRSLDKSASKSYP